MPNSEYKNIGNNPLLVERERQLARCLKTLSKLENRCEEQEQEISNQEKTLLEKEKHIEFFQNELECLYKSNSWRITAPLRYVMLVIHSFRLKAGKATTNSTENINTIAENTENNRNSKIWEKGECDCANELEWLKREVKYWRLQTMSLLDELESIREKQENCK